MNEEGFLKSLDTRIQAMGEHVVRISDAVAAIKAACTACDIWKRGVDKRMNGLDAAYRPVRDRVMMFTGAAMVLIFLVDVMLRVWPLLANTVVR